MAVLAMADPAVRLAETMPIVSVAPVVKVAGEHHPSPDMAPVVTKVARAAARAGRTTLGGLPPADSVAVPPSQTLTKTRLFKQQP